MKALLILLSILIVTGILLSILIVSGHTLSASDFMYHYQRDAYGANEKYGDKIVSLTGIIHSIKKYQWGINIFRYEISLRAKYPPPFTSSEDTKVELVMCIFSPSEAYSLHLLEKQDWIKIKGKVSSEGLSESKYSNNQSYFYVILDDCILLEIKDAAGYYRKDDILRENPHLRGMWGRIKGIGRYSEVVIISLIFLFTLIFLFFVFRGILGKNKSQ